MKTTEFPSLNGLTVLAVDDDSFNRFIIMKILTLWGIKADIVPSGAEALRKLRDTRYNVVLMDIEMPEMDGFEVVRILRTWNGHINRDVPVYAFSSREDLSGLEEAGMKGAISKSPLDFKALHAALSGCQYL